MPCVHRTHSVMLATLACIGMGLLADPAMAAVGRTHRLRHRCRCRLGYHCDRHTYAHVELA